MLQQQLFEAFKQQDEDRLAELFGSLKAAVAPENVRLEGLILKCLDKYRLANARWKFIEDIYSYDDGAPQRVLSGLQNMPKSDKLLVHLAEAEWRDAAFR